MGQIKQTKGGNRGQELGKEEERGCRSNDGDIRRKMRGEKSD